MNPFTVSSYLAAAAAAKSLQSCPTLCDPIDSSPPGSPIPGILQARTLEWVGIFFSNAWKWKVKVKSLSHVRLLATPWTAAYQAPPSMGFSRQDYWSGVPSPSLSYLASPAQNATVQTASHLMFKRENICVWSKSEGRRAPLSFGCKATVHGLEMSALPLTAWIFLNKLFDLSVLQNLNL